jgi:hypothetical protein
MELVNELAALSIAVSILAAVSLAGFEIAA